MSEDDGAGRAGQSNPQVQDIAAAREAVRAAIARAVEAGAFTEEVAAEATAELDAQQGDAYALHEWMRGHKPLKAQFCGYPGCFEPPRPRKEGAKGGAAPVYCDVVRDAQGKPEHTAVRSLRMKDQLQAGGPRAALSTAAPVDPGFERPVALARESVPVIAQRVGQLIADQQAVLSRQMEQLTAAVGRIGDDEARQAEFESVAAEADKRIGDEAGRRRAAEQRAREAGSAAERARTNEEEALAAARELAERVEQVEADAAERIAAVEAAQRAQAELDQGRVENAEAAERAAVEAMEKAKADAERQVREAAERAEEQVRAANERAAEQIVAANAEAERKAAEARDERDNAIAEHQAVADAQVREANETAEAAWQDRDIQVRAAEAEVARAEQARDDAKTAREELQGELNALRTKAGDDETRFREELKAERDRHQAEVGQLGERLRDAEERAGKAREELAGVKAQLETERAAHARELDAANARTAEARTAAAEDAERRVADVRTTYDAQLAELRAQLAAATGDEGRGKRR